ncbi:MAG: cell division protein FtsZ [Candidatus Eisenbacteria bacterium]|nr:cell division protein FtsZ [Candidatus Eisenbacteria bacterium]
MLEMVENRTSPAVLKVFGVGGGGSNAVNRMVSAGLNGVEFWIANTDQQALHHAPCANRLQIGTNVTRGRGAGGDPEIGRLSAEEDADRIQEIVFGADMLFITAGMGGGTGTGAAPVIAKLARELGILTVAIVTKPFAFEGKRKFKRAMDGLDALREHVDTLIAIPNQKLMHIVPPGTSFESALLLADEVLFQATRGISDLIIGHGIINLDFADVRTVMRNRGNALLGCGSAIGADRAVEAAAAAVSSPLLEELSITGAEALLVNVQGGSSMSFHEAAEAAQYISDRAGEEADVFWGAVVDPTMGEEMRVTIIATGFTPNAVPAPEPNYTPRRELIETRRDYAPDPGYASGAGYGSESGFASGSGYASDSGYSRGLDTARAESARESELRDAIPSAPSEVARGEVANDWQNLAERGLADRADRSPSYAATSSLSPAGFGTGTTPSSNGFRNDAEEDLFLPGGGAADAESAIGLGARGATSTNDSGASERRPGAVYRLRPESGREIERSSRDTDWRTREVYAESRSGQRDPLDVPTFLRKRMD